MSPALLTDSGGSSTGVVQAGTVAGAGLATSVHTINTPYDPDLNPITDIVDVKARQAR
jgi:hypothetical protein